MWDLPRPGIKPMSPALAGRFPITGPIGKSLSLFLMLFFPPRHPVLSNSSSEFLFHNLLEFNNQNKWAKHNWIGGNTLRSAKMEENKDPELTSYHGHIKITTICKPTNHEKDQNHPEQIFYKSRHKEGTTMRWVAGVDSQYNQIPYPWVGDSQTRE